MVGIAAATAVVGCNRAVFEGDGIGHCFDSGNGSVERQDKDAVDSGAEGSRPIVGIEVVVSSHIGVDIDGEVFGKSADSRIGRSRSPLVEWCLGLAVESVMGIGGASVRAIDADGGRVEGDEGERDEGVAQSRIVSEKGVGVFSCKVYIAIDEEYRIAIADTIGDRLAEDLFADEGESFGRVTARDGSVVDGITAGDSVGLAAEIRGIAQINGIVERSAVSGIDMEVEGNATIALKGRGNDLLVTAGLAVVAAQEKNGIVVANGVVEVDVVYGIDVQRHNDVAIGAMLIE